MEFEAMLISKDGTYFELNQLCDGSLQSSVSFTSCTFGMLQITQSPLFLIQGDLIVAIARANNSIGWGAFSAPNFDGQSI